MDNLVTIYKTLGDAQRLAILKMLTGHELSVCEIMQRLNLSQPAVSHHLRILKQGNFVKSTKHGKLVLYTLNYCGLEEIYPLIRNHLSDLLCSAAAETKPSALRENPNYCELMGLKKSICEQE